MPTILVTGARQGLGLELTRQYAGAGWSVIATCLQPETAADLKAVTGAVQIHDLDNDNHAAVDALAARLRGTPIDVLYNNAGIKGGEHQDFGSYDYEMWMRVLRTNLLGPMKMAEAFVDHVAASNRRLIVNMASGHASMAWNVPEPPGPPPGKLLYYRTSKAGLNMVTRNLANELRPRGITVLSLAPGHVKTEMGGADAPLDIVTSVTGIRRVIDATTPADSGRFLLYDGRTYAW